MEALKQSDNVHESSGCSRLVEDLIGHYRVRHTHQYEGMRLVRKHTL